MRTTVVASTSILTVTIWSSSHLHKCVAFNPLVNLWRNKVASSNVNSSQFPDLPIVIVASSLSSDSDSSSSAQDAGLTSFIDNVEQTTKAAMNTQGAGLVTPFQSNLIDNSRPYNPPESSSSTSIYDSWEIPRSSPPPARKEAWEIQEEWEVPRTFNTNSRSSNVSTPVGNWMDDVIKPVKSKNDSSSSSTTVKTTSIQRQESNIISEKNELNIQVNGDTNDSSAQVTTSSIPILEPKVISTTDEIQSQAKVIEEETRQMPDSTDTTDEIQNEVYMQSSSASPIQVTDSKVTTDEIQTEAKTQSSSDITTSPIQVTDSKVTTDEIQTEAKTQSSSDITTSPIQVTDSKVTTDEIQTQGKENGESSKISTKPTVSSASLQVSNDESNSTITDKNTTQAKVNGVNGSHNTQKTPTKTLSSTTSLQNESKANESQSIPQAVAVVNEIKTELTPFEIIRKKQTDFLKKRERPPQPPSKTKAEASTKLAPPKGFGLKFKLNGFGGNTGSSSTTTSTTAKNTKNQSKETKQVSSSDDDRVTTTQEQASVATILKRKKTDFLKKRERPTPQSPPPAKKESPRVGDSSSSFKGFGKVNGGAKKPSSKTEVKVNGEMKNVESSSAAATVSIKSESIVENSQSKTIEKANGEKLESELNPPKIDLSASSSSQSQPKENVNGEKLAHDLPLNVDIELKTKDLEKNNKIESVQPNVDSSTDSSQESKDIVAIVEKQKEYLLSARVIYYRSASKGVRFYFSQPRVMEDTSESSKPAFVVVSSVDLDTAPDTDIEKSDISPVIDATTSTSQVTLSNNKAYEQKKTDINELEAQSIGTEEIIDSSISLESSKNAPVSDFGLVKPSVISAPPINGTPLAASDEIEMVIIPVEKSLTQRIMEKTSVDGQTGGAGGTSTYEAFLQANANFKKLKQSKEFDVDPRSINEFFPKFVSDDGTIGSKASWEKLRQLYEQDVKKLDYDVVICGGTLGIFLAVSLQKKGHKVAVIEAREIKGREQEWNISRDELEELVHLGVLTQEEIEEAITTEFELCRSGFKNKEVTPTVGSYFENGVGYECFTKDVLNLGVAPATLLSKAKTHFEQLGGTIYENTPINGIVISDSIGAAIDISSKSSENENEEKEPITARLILDCMGNGSPISRQQRYGRKPDGICCVVGSCAGGYDPKTNIYGDIIYTNSELQDKGDEGMLQYFWEAFPVGIGRNGKEPGTSDVKTTYMFTYLDANEKRPDLTTLMDDYWRLLPIYQPSIKDVEKDLDVKRVLFAYFPTYRDSPLKPAWSRLLAVGDASGIQSPLSFGGFGALTRHMGRLTDAISEALDEDLLHKDDLSLINDYTPNLSASWMFQKAMSVRVGQKTDTKFINRLLANNFQIMEDMGVDTIKPFLQDVIRVDGLVGSLARSFVADPFFMPAIVGHVGIPTLVEWIGHVSVMGLYSVNHSVVSPVISPIVDDYIKDARTRFIWRRRMEAWKFGSGGDYILPSDKMKETEMKKPDEEK